MGNDIMNVDQQVQTWDRMHSVAEAMLKTHFLPPALKTAEQVIMVVMTGRELNVPMMEALRGINIINQKPAVAPQLMLGMINRSGQLQDMQIEKGDNKVTVTMTRKGRSPHSATFGAEEAKAMWLAGKDNYKKQPMNMYKWRAISACARVVFPDVIGGLYLTEEVENLSDVDEKAAIVDQTKQITASPENYDEWLEEFRAKAEAEIAAMKEPAEIRRWEMSNKAEIGILMDKDREEIRQMLADKQSELITGLEKGKKEDREPLNLRQYMDLAKERKDATALREWFKSIQENAKADLSEADFTSLIAEMKRMVSQMRAPELKEAEAKAAELSEYLREAQTKEEFDKRLSEITKERNKLPKVMRTWLNDEIASIQDGYKAKKAK